MICPLRTQGCLHCCSSCRDPAQPLSAPGSPLEGPGGWSLWPKGDKNATMAPGSPWGRLAAELLPGLASAASGGSLCLFALTLRLSFFRSISSTLCLSSSGLGCPSEDVPFGAVTLVPGPPFPLLGQWGLSPPLLVAKFIPSHGYSGPTPCLPLPSCSSGSGLGGGGVFMARKGQGLASSSLASFTQRLDF